MPVPSPGTARSAPLPQFFPPKRALPHPTVDRRGAHKRLIRWTFERSSCTGLAQRQATDDDETGEAAGLRPSPPAQRFQPVHVREVIERALVLVADKLCTQGIEAVKVLDESDPAVLGDRDQLTQVFINLITNAADAMSSGGRLTVRIEVRRIQDVAYVSARVTEHGHRYRRGTPGEDLRVVLHHQAGGQGHRPGPGRHPGHREEPRGDDRGRERARPGHDHDRQPATRDPRHGAPPPGAADMRLHVATPVDAGATAAERSEREVSSAVR